jgi:hypothetical protein
MKILSAFATKVKNIMAWLTSTDDESFLKLFTLCPGDKNMFYRRNMAMRCLYCILRSAPPTFGLSFIIFIIATFKIRTEENFIIVYKFYLYFILGYIILLFIINSLLIIVGWVVPSKAMDKIKLHISKEGATLEASQDKTVSKADSTAP